MSEKLETNCIRRKVTARLYSEQHNKEYLGVNRCRLDNPNNCHRIGAKSGASLEKDRTNCIHAEMDALEKALADGVTDFSSYVIYVSNKPCHDCINHLGKYKIKVVYENDYNCEKFDSIIQTIAFYKNKINIRYHPKEIQTLAV